MAIVVEVEKAVEVEKIVVVVSLGTGFEAVPVSCCGTGRADSPGSGGIERAATLLCEDLRAMLVEARNSEATMKVRMRVAVERLRPD